MNIYMNIYSLKSSGNKAPRLSESSFYQTGKTTAIRRIAVRETRVSRQIVGQIEGPFNTIVCRVVRGFEGALNFPPRETLVFQSVAFPVIFVQFVHWKENARTQRDRVLDSCRSFYILVHAYT